MMKEFDKQKLFDSYAAALSKAWESYIKIIDLLLGLAGATALVFVASIKITDWANLPNNGCILYVFIFSAMAMIFGVCWRFARQHFMEYETLGSRYAVGPWGQAFNICILLVGSDRKRRFMVVTTGTSTRHESFNQALQPTALSYCFFCAFIGAVGCVALDFFLAFLYPNEYTPSQEHHNPHRHF